MNCKDLLMIVNPPAWTLFPEVVWQRRSEELQAMAKMLGLNKDGDAE